MNYKKLFLCVAILTTVVCHAAGKPAEKVYVFGIATVLNDSTVYLTDIQVLDSAGIYGKGHFLYSRNNYSYQLRDHLGKCGVANAMCVTTYATKQKKIEKRYLALRKKYAKRAGFTIKYVEKKDFRYECIKPE